MAGHTERLAVLQDDQFIGEENEATSVLVLPRKTGDRKTRVAAPWLEACGWRTQLIEPTQIRPTCCPGSIGWSRVLP